MKGINILLGLLMSNRADMIEYTSKLCEEYNSNARDGEYRQIQFMQTEDDLWLFLAFKMPS
jgi:hypothetical protein